MNPEDTMTYQMPNPFNELVERPAPTLPTVPYLPPVILIPPAVIETIVKAASKTRKPRSKRKVH